MERAVVEGDSIQAEAAIREGADVNGRNLDGKLPLGLAKSIEIIKFLIGKGADVNAKVDGDGNTLLHQTDC